jgi:hypothetical protein
MQHRTIASSARSTGTSLIALDWGGTLKPPPIKSTMQKVHGDDETQVCPDPVGTVQRCITVPPVQKKDACSQCCRLLVCIRSTSSKHNLHPHGVAVHPPSPRALPAQQPLQGPPPHGPGRWASSTPAAAAAAARPIDQPRAASAHCSREYPRCISGKPAAAAPAALLVTAHDHVPRLRYAPNEHSPHDVVQMRTMRRRQVPHIMAAWHAHRPGYTWDVGQRR